MFFEDFPANSDSDMDSYGNPPISGKRRKNDTVRKLHTTGLQKIKLKGAETRFNMGKLVILNNFPYATGKNT